MSHLYDISVALISHDIIRLDVTTNMLLQQKSMQMGNNLAEQQVNNNNKAKTEPQMQVQLSSPLSEVLKTYSYNFGNCENCELKVKFSEL